MRVGKRFTLFIWKEDMNDNIKIIKLLENSCVLIDGVTEIVKHEIRRQKARRQISSNFVGSFGCFLCATSNFFSNKRYKWRRS